MVVKDNIVMLSFKATAVLSSIMTVIREYPIWLTKKYMKYIQLDNLKVLDKRIFLNFTIK